jgi:hypothetical protein
LHGGTGWREEGNSVTDYVELTDAAALRAMIGQPIKRVADKVRSSLHELDLAWLAQSPFCLVATADAEGNLDVSPKGDPAGFALALDDRTIAIPDRPGNRRVDGFLNILANPHVGVLFLVPGRGDTLRVNGRARLVTDAPFFDRMTVEGHRPGVVTLIEIDEVFYHCSKAFQRSSLWNPESWQPESVPSRAEIAHAVERPEDSLETVRAYYGPGYASNLYGS